MELKSEQKIDDMIDILLSLQKYVPRVPATNDVPSPGGTTVRTVDSSEVRNIVFGKCYYIINQTYFTTEFYRWGPADSLAY